MSDKYRLFSRMGCYVSMAGLIFSVVLGIAVTILGGVFTCAHAAGGDALPGFPVLDARTGLQRATAAVVDTSGSQIIAGYQNLSGSTDDEFLTVKINPDGSVAWRSTHNHSGGSDRIVAVLADGDNNIIVAGYVWNGSNNDIHTIKYRSSDGAVLWENTWNGPAGGSDIATSLAYDSLGNLLYVAGFTQNSSGDDDFVVIKYTNPPSGPANPPDGTYIYTGAAAGPDRIKAIAANAAGFVVTGETYNGTDFDALTVQYTSAGVKLREWTYASSAGQNDVGKAIALDSDGNPVVAARVSYATDTDIVLLKYNGSTGVTLWQKKYDGGFNDEPMALTADGTDIYLLGMTWTLAGHDDIYLARYLGATGEPAWTGALIYNSGGDDADFPVGLAVGTGASGGVFVTGYAVTAVSNDILTIKASKSNGTLFWQQRYNGTADRDDRPVGIGFATPSGNICVAGWTDSWSSGATDYDLVSLRYDFGPIDPPTSLTATAVTDNAIQISWSSNAPNADGYIVERKLGDSGSYTQIATVGPGITTYADPGLAANNYYYYRVRAYNAANGNSAYSNEAHALTKVVSYTVPVWTYTYNGINNSEDYALSIAAGGDDHPVVTGYSTLEEVGVPGTFSTDYYTVKLDRTTKVEKWNARYDSSSGGMDRATVVSVLPDNDVFVTGNAYLSGAGGFDTDEIYTIKYQASTHTDPLQPPTEVWNDQFGYAGSDRASAVAVATDASKKSVITGFGVNASGNDDIYVLKYNPDGSRAWPAAIYDSGRNEYPTAVAFDTVGNVFVTGYTESPRGDTDWFTAKYDSAQGTLLWSDTFDGGAYGNDYARSLAVDASGNAYVTGYITTAAGLDFYTIKYDGAVASAKRRIWEKRHDGPVHGDDKGISVKVDPIDGSVMVAGTQATTAGDRDFHLIRYQASDGVVIWERTFDRPGSYEYLSAMTLDSSGYIYVAGNSRSGPDFDVSFDASSNILSLIYDFEGTFLGALLHDGGGRQNEVEAITANNRGEAFIAGFWKNTSGNADYLVLKQTNAYILVPAPFTVTPQVDYTRLNLTWQENSPGTSYRIWRTLGPVTSTSDWGTPRYDGPAGTSSFEDSGLVQGVNYCYRIEAYSGSLNSRQIITCATTVLPAVILAPLYVPPLPARQIELSWGNVPANNGYRIERKIEAGSWSVLAETVPNATGYNDENLTAGTLYSYRVTVLNAGGGSAPSNVVSATTIPEAPLQGAPSEVRSSQVTLNWSNVSGETGYKIERREGTGGSWTPLALTPGQDAIAATDTSLAANTNYFYRIKATNAAGDSVYSNEQAVLSLFTSTTLITASAGSSTSTINLAWDNVAGETGYTVQVSTCNYNNGANDISYCIAGYEWAWSGWSGLITVAADGTNYQHEGLTAGFAYRYRVIANVSGNSSDPSNVKFAWTALAAPATIDVSPASETALTVSWSDVAGETGYAVERTLASPVNWAVVAAAGALAANTVSFTDDGLGLQTAYCYRVKASSSNSATSATSVEKCLSTPLPAPELNLPVSPLTSEIDLSWSNVTGNTGYELQWQYLGNPDYPSGNDWGAWSTPVALAANTTSHHVTGLTPGYTYQFRVRDTYSGGVSAWSNLRSLTTIPVAPVISGIQIDSTSQMTVLWSNVYGETNYGLEWKSGSGGSWSAPITIAGNISSYVHSGLAADTTYYYRIRATSSGGTSDYSSEVFQTTSLPELNPLTGVTIAKIDLSWNSIPGNSGYTIERKIENGDWTTLTTTAANAVAYSDAGLTAGTLYSYRLRMLTATGATAPTNERAATTTPNSTPLTVKVLTASQTEYSWPVTLGATNYKIYRRLESNGSYEDPVNRAASYATNYCGFPVPRIDCAAPTPLMISGIDSGLAANTRYCYMMTAWNSTGGDSALSSEVCVTTSAMANETITAQALNSFKVRISWTEISCAACGPPQGYELERKVAYGTWVPIANIAAPQKEFIDGTGINALQKYTYRVRSYNAMDRSPYSETSITMPAYQADDSVCQ